MAFQGKFYTPTNPVEANYGQLLSGIGYGTNAAVDARNQKLKSLTDMLQIKAASDLANQNAGIALNKMQAEELTPSKTATTIKNFQDIAKGNYDLSGDDSTNLLTAQRIGNASPQDARGFVAQYMGGTPSATIANQPSLSGQVAQGALNLGVGGIKALGKKLGIGNNDVDTADQGGELVSETTGTMGPVTGNNYSQPNAQGAFQLGAEAASPPALSPYAQGKQAEITNKLNTGLKAKADVEKAQIDEKRAQGMTIEGGRKVAVGVSGRPMLRIDWTPELGAAIQANKFLSDADRSKQIRDVSNIGRSAALLDDRMRELGQLIKQSGDNVSLKRIATGRINKSFGTDIAEYAYEVSGGNPALNQLIQQKANQIAAGVFSLAQAKGERSGRLSDQDVARVEGLLPSGGMSSKTVNNLAAELMRDTKNVIDDAALEGLDGITDPLIERYESRTGKPYQWGISDMDTGTIEVPGMQSESLIDVTPNMDTNIGGLERPSLKQMVQDALAKQKGLKR